MPADRNGLRAAPRNGDCYEAEVVSQTREPGPWCVGWDVQVTALLPRPRPCPLAKPRREVMQMGLQFAHLERGGRCWGWGSDA